MRAPFILRIVNWFAWKAYDPKTSPLILWFYRAALRAFEMAGITVDHRIMSFSVPYLENCYNTEKMLSELSDHLKKLGISSRTKRRSLSAEEARANPDTAEFCREGMKGIYFYELLVLSRQYPEAGEAVSEFMSQFDPQSKTSNHR